MEVEGVVVVVVGVDFTFSPFAMPALGPSRKMKSWWTLSPSRRKYPGLDLVCLPPVNHTVYNIKQEIVMLPELTFQSFGEIPSSGIALKIHLSDTIYWADDGLSRYHE